MIVKKPISNLKSSLHCFWNFINVFNFIVRTGSSSWIRNNLLLFKFLSDSKSLPMTWPTKLSLITPHEFKCFFTNAAYKSGCKFNTFSFSHFWIEMILNVVHWGPRSVFKCRKAACTLYAANLSKWYTKELCSRSLFKNIVFTEKILIPENKNSLKKSK